MERAPASTLVGTTAKLNTVIENGASHPVTYDAAGNELAAGASSYAYSPRNTLASADTSSYLYDGRGVMTVGTFSVLAVNFAPGTVACAGADNASLPLAAPAGVYTGPAPCTTTASRRSTTADARSLQ